MRSRTDICRRAVGVGLLLIATATTAPAANAQPVSAPSTSAAPGATALPAVPPVLNDADIDRALDALRVDENLMSTRTIKTLRRKNPATSAPTGLPAWLRWMAQLIRWIEQSARVLVWAAVALAAGALAIYITQLARSRQPLNPDEGFVPPSQVRDLDIRPETLPADIGAAARQLWDRGEHRPALALLYRGLLSRLAYVHRTPIRESSTEGDTLGLAADRVTPPVHDYARRLVYIWQRSVYGHEDVPETSVHDLCDRFTMLDQASLVPSPASGGPA